MFREFFYLQKSDRQVILALLVVITVALCGIFLLGGSEETGAAAGAGAADSTAVATRHWQSAPPHAPHYYQAQERRPAERFPFDPNTADSTQLLRLGLQPWQVRNIYKYRAAGGIYRRKQDFARLYGLTVQQYRQLEPYIRISPDYQPAAALSRTHSALSRTHSAPADAPAVSLRRDTLRYPAKLHAGEHLELNAADTAALRRVPGVGHYYAKEIVRYGRWLGGYVSVDQLDEIEGFPQKAKAYLVIQSANPRKLNVNRLSINELRRHPYINYHQAKAIADYRRTHGPIRHLSDLKLSKDFPPEAIERLLPYVEY